MDGATKVGELNLFESDWSLAIVHEDITWLDIWDQARQNALKIKIIE